MVNKMASGENFENKTSEPGPVHETTQTGVRVSVRKENQYKGDDPVDTYLLNQLAKHVKYESLGTLARDLNIEDTAYLHIAAPKDRIWRILSLWKEVLPKNYKVNDFITEVQEWYNEDFLDDQVWERLEKCTSFDILERVKRKKEPEREIFSKESSEPETATEVRPKGHDPSLSTSLSSLTLSTASESVTTMEAAFTINAETSSTETLLIGALLDEHILELSKRIPTGEELMDLGIKVLHLSECKINAALYNHSYSIQKATHELLSTWLKRQASRKEAYTNLYSDLRKGEMKQLAGLVKQWVEGVGEETVDEIQNALKDVLHERWKKCMPNEWLSPTLAQSEKLIQCYVEPNMTWKPVLGKIKSPLNRFQDIFTHLGAGIKRILVKAARGRGKTCVVTHLAWTWINESVLRQFDFIFLIALEQVKKASSLVELVIDQMGLNRTAQHHLQAILEGKANRKVLLILDGYDKYIPGTNKNIDKVVEMGLKSGTVIITCCYGDYLHNQVQKQMDAVVDIKGFDYLKFAEWAKLYFGSATRWEKMKEHYDDLCHHSMALVRPIDALMASVIYIEKHLSLKTETKLFCTVLEMILIRASEKTFACQLSELNDLEIWLGILGEMSWRSLQKDVRQHLLEKKEVERCPQVLSLGLLKDLGDHVMFHCQPLHHLLAAKHVVHMIETSQNGKVVLNELFPSFYVVMTNQEVLAPVVGLSRDPRPIVTHVHELHKKMLVKDLRSGNMDRERLDWLEDQGKIPDDPFLFISLYGESTMELPGSWNHNEHWNKYGNTDHFYKTFKGRVAPVYFPSKMYMFSPSEEKDIGGIEHRHQEGNSERPECAMMIAALETTMVNKVFALCRKISEQQTITDFMMDCIKGDFLTEAEVPNLGRNIQSLKVINSKLPVHFMRNILHQLFDCSTLKTIDLHCVELHEIETDLDQLLKNLSSHCLKQKTELRLVVTKSMVSPKFCKKWAWNSEETGIIFYDKPRKEDNIDDLYVDEINWLIQELESKHDGFGETFNCQYPSLKKSVDYEELCSQSSSKGINREEEKTEKAAHNVPSNRRSETQDACSSGLLCSLMDNYHGRNEELSLEEINWLIQEQELNSHHN